MVVPMSKSVYAVFEEHDGQKRLQDIYESKSDAKDAVDETYNQHVDAEPNRDRGLYSKLIDRGRTFGYWVERVPFYPEGESQ